MSVAVYCAWLQVAFIPELGAGLLLVNEVPGVAALRELPLANALQVPFVTRIAFPPNGFREGQRHRLTALEYELHGGGPVRVDVAYH